jgi:hypothetical protein
MGNEYDQPPIVEEDNDTVENASRDTSGKDRAFKNRINTLDSVRSACTEELVQIHHIDSAQQTVDQHTKLQGPMDHWRHIASTMGESPQLSAYRQRVFDRYAKRRPPTHEVNVAHEADSTWGEGSRPWEEADVRPEDAIHELEERGDHYSTLTSCASDVEEMEAHEQRVVTARRNATLNALPPGPSISTWIKEQLHHKPVADRCGVSTSRAVHALESLAQGDTPSTDAKRDDEETRQKKNRQAAQALFHELAEPADSSPQRRRSDEDPLSPVMQTHETFSERGTLRTTRKQKRRRERLPTAK